MGIFRNREMKLQLIAGGGATALCSLLLFFIVKMTADKENNMAAWQVAGAAMAGAVFTGIVINIIWFYMNILRYKEIEKLIGELDDILHGNQKIDLSRMREGDLEVLRDEIQKMIVRLREQNEGISEEKKSLSKSLTDISHQIRTPLTSLNLMLEKLKSSNTEELEKKKCCRDMEKMLERIEWLINSLLKMAKLEAGTVALEKASVSVKQMAEEAFSLFEILMELRNQKVVYEGLDEVTVECDRLWTLEAIGNVVKNSMEHTPEHGVICVSWKENPLFTEISIADSGNGIDREDLPHLFERFYRGKQSGNLNFGIGLAFSRQILTTQNAVIFAENAKCGGARFVIRFYKTVV